MEKKKLSNELTEILNRTGEICKSQDCPTVALGIVILEFLKSRIDDDIPDKDHSILWEVIKTKIEDDIQLSTYKTKFIPNYQLQLINEVKRCLNGEGINSEQVPGVGLCLGIDVLTCLSTSQKLIEVLKKPEIGVDEFIASTFYNNLFERLTSISLTIDNMISSVRKVDSTYGNILDDNLVNFFNGSLNKLLDVIKGEPFDELLKSTSGDLIEKSLNWTSIDDSPSTFNSINEGEFEAAGKLSTSSSTYKGETKTPMLDEYSINLTEQAKSNKLDPVIGREVEINRLIEILSCRKKNNAAILGDPGCGKSALVEKLAQLVADGLVPDGLKNIEIRQLNLNMLVSGTKFRGEYEERLEKIIKEVMSNKNIVIYIDELHNLVGSGSTSGSGDGSNILKPYLARGEFKCIGATTLEEYRKFIEKDGALKRRFQNIILKEPTIDETVQILSNIKTSYSDFHGVSYSDEVIKLCVEWSGRYITDRYFPDKAIDILDMAGSMAKLNRESIIDYSKLNNIKERIKEEELQKTLCVENMDFDKGIEHEKVVKSLQSKLKKEEKRIESRINKPIDVSVSDVCSVISKISNVPIDKINSDDMDKLRIMKSIMTSQVIGQDAAINRITTSLQRNSLGLRDTNKPIANLLFVGPTGVGKTHICKKLAKEFFGSEKKLIKFDMAEFASAHDVSKLIGAAASYVGYEDSPLLEKVRRNPYSVILFDEIEKASSKIFDIFLTIMDEGSITLANGVKVDFKNTIIILTGNVGTSELSLRGNGLGFSKKDSEKAKETDLIVKAAVKKRFRPEFINRLTDTIVFNSLGEKELSEIFELEISHLVNRLAQNNLNLTVTTSVKDYIISKCNPEYGARDLQRSIIKYIEESICETLLNKKSTSKEIKVDYVKGSIKVSFIKSNTKKSLVKSKEVIESLDEVMTES